MRVFSAELRSLFLPWAEVGPLMGPRSRWIGIPRYPEHRHNQPNLQGNQMYIKGTPQDHRDVQDSQNLT
jgi:hypothetical protein